MTPVSARRCCALVATSALAACTLTLGDSWSSGIPEAAAANDPLIDLLNPFADLSPSAPNPILGHRESLAAGEQTQASNDIVALSINASAGAELVDAALADATADPALAMSEALGTQLGPLFAEALQHGDLPKTSSLLNEGLRDGLANPSNAKAHFAYKRPFIRLGFADQGGHLTRTSSPEYAKLAKDGSFPSGHTINGYLAGTALATLLPEFGPQLLARASQFAHHRIVLAMHYPLDVMGGRMAAQRVLQARWSNAGSREVLDDAAAELRSVLTSRCQTAGHGPDLKACASAGTAYLSTEAAVAVYTERLTYGLGSVLPVTAPCGGEGSDQLVAAIPPGAEDLLLTAAPSLDASGRRALLAATAAAPGSPLDTRTGQGSWVRLNLAAAMAAAAHPTSPPPTTAIPNGPITAIKASQRSVTLIEGSFYTIPAGAYIGSGPRIRPSFVSASPSVAPVSRTGRVTALTPGKATVTLCAGGMSTRVTVTVRTARSKPVTLTALRTAGIPAQMVSGQTALARASYRPARAVRVKVRYESSRPSVLSVDSAGRLVAKRPGTAIITVKAGPRRADVRVRVTAS